MARLQRGSPARVEVFVDRSVDLALAFPSDRRLGRVVDQLMGSCTAVGANVAEADEAMSDRDFCKSLAIALKELNESCFWFGLAGRKQGVPCGELAWLMEESRQLKLIVATIIKKTRSRHRSD
ncbi:MAG: hypothetical protein AMXMBFR58_05010 [Phycisphaerae bacterium]